MKRLSFIVLVILIGSISLKAQRPDRPNMDPKEMANRTVSELTQQVKLSPAVQDSLKVAFVAFYDDMRKERESGNRPDREKFEVKRDTRIKKFLTDDQYKAYQKFMEERRARRNRPDGQDRPMRPEGR